MLSVSAAILRPLQTAAPSNPGTDLNRQAARYVGQEFTLTNPIVNGHGRLTMGGGTWLIGGPDLPSGARVRVVAFEGPRLRVIGA